MKKEIMLPLMLVLLASCQSAVNVLEGVDVVFKDPKSLAYQTLNSNTVSRSALVTLQSLDPYFADSKNENFVLSPASYLLATSGVAAVSDGFNNSELGLTADAGQDVKELLTAWNFEHKDTSEHNPSYCYFRSAILHQQVGPRYQFDTEKREQVADDYISTMVSSLKDYHSDATKYFHDGIGLNINIPNPNLDVDSVITYGGLKMKDYIPNGLGEESRDFTTNNQTFKVTSDAFGSVNMPYETPYYDGDGYQAFSLKMNMTNLLIILPDENVNVNSIKISEAYESFMENRINNTPTIGYVPYFHLTTEGTDLTYAFKSKLTNEEVLFSKLLDADVVNDLTLASVLQSSDFEFNKNGISGESITMVVASGSSAPSTNEPVILNVNRPFYAIALKDNFPVFVNKVNNPSK